MIYFQQSRFADAIAPLRRALKLKPSLPNVDSLLAMSLSEIGRHDEALPGLEKAFDQKSTDAALRRMVGLHLQRAYTDLGRDSSAVTVALELSRRYPDDPEVLYHAGRLFGNYAYLQMVRLSRIAPDSVWLHQAAGEANESQGLFDEAIKEYQQVLALSPKRPGLHFRIGRALLSRSVQAKGDAAAEAAALSEFEQELQIDPSNANAAYEIGEMQRKSGRARQSRRVLHQGRRVVSRVRGGARRARTNPRRGGRIPCGAAPSPESHFFEPSRRGRLLSDRASAPRARPGSRAAGGARRVRAAAQREGAAGRGRSARTAERHQAGHRSDPTSVDRSGSMATAALQTSRFAMIALVAATLGAAPNFNQPDSRVVFTDITASTGITFTHVSAPEKKYIVESMSGGVGLFDFDKDGWLDVYLVNSPTVATAAQSRRRPKRVVAQQSRRYVHRRDRARRRRLPGMGDGRGDGRLRQRRLGGPLRHLLRRQSPVPQQWGWHVHRRHGARRRR